MLILVLIIFFICCRKIWCSYARCKETLLALII